ncbi:MAG: hypothetical protein AB8H79_26785, partial [Myxococcota bacterium]
MPRPLIVPTRIAIVAEPGSVESGPAVIHRGPLAGMAELLDFQDWKSEVALVRRSAARNAGLAWAQDSLDLQDLPHLRQRVQSSVLTVVDPSDADRLAKQGSEVVWLGYHRGGGGGGLRVSRDGVTRGFQAVDAELHEAAGISDEDVSIMELYSAVLGALTDGTLSLYDVDLAIWCDELQGSDLESLEDAIAAAQDPSAEDQALATAVCAALDGADDADEVQLPVLGPATRQRWPGFDLISSEDTLAVQGPPIRVPALERWMVLDVDAVPEEEFVASFTSTEHGFAPPQLRKQPVNWRLWLRVAGGVAVAALLIAAVVQFVNRAPRDVGLPIDLIRRAADVQVDTQPDRVVVTHRVAAGVLDVLSVYQRRLSGEGFVVGPLRLDRGSPPNVRAASLVAERDGEQ